MSIKVTVFANQRSGIRVISKAEDLGCVEDTVADLIADPRFGLVSMGRGGRLSSKFRTHGDDRA